MSKFQNLNLDDWFDEDEALKAINDIETGKFWRPKKDKTNIRILPPIKANGEKLFYFTHRVHWINRMPYECINQTLVDKDGREHVAESCPICSLTKQLFKIGETDEEALKEAKAISAKSKDVVRILVRDEGEAKIQFYEMPVSVKNLLLTAISSGDYGSPPIHPVTGNDFSLQRTGSGQQTKYDSSYILPKEYILDLLEVSKSDIREFAKIDERIKVVNHRSGTQVPIPEDSKEIPYDLINYYRRFKTKFNVSVGHEYFSGFGFNDKEISFNTISLSIFFVF